MRVFVAGATGAIGTPLLRQLREAGHEVTGMTRSPERVERIRAAGAEAVVCDAFDAAGLEAAVAAAKPEAVVHALTALPPKLKLRGDWTAATNRLRTEGTRNLLAAAEAAGARRLVGESIAFLYRPEGDMVKDEEAPVYEDAPSHFGAAFRATLDLERQLTGAAVPGLALRCGYLYGPGTWYGRGGSEAANVAKRRTPVIGAGSGTFSWLHVEDAASAFVAALEHGEPGVYNVVDDEPAPMREWLPVYAAALGAKPPRRVPPWLVGLIAGPAFAEFGLEMRGADNAKAKRELGWQPRHPSWRQGFAESLR